jgi:hypothetical protein
MQVLSFTQFHVLPDSHIFISDSVSTLSPSQEEVLGCHKYNEEQIDICIQYIHLLMFSVHFLFVNV